MPGDREKSGRQESGTRPRDGLDRRLAELSDRIAGLEPHRAADLYKSGACLVDIREPHELEEGTPAGSTHLPRGSLELEIQSHLPETDQPVILMCASGQRSLLAAEALQQLGYQRVYNLVGGFRAWKGAGLPIEYPRVDGDRFRTRYARHLAMPEVGEAGQKTLLASSVLIVGAGGLGSPAAFYLAAAGVGRIGLVDGDRVERSNLQRQILHTDAAVGHPKTASAAERIHALNPDVRLDTYPVRLDATNAESIVGDSYDIVLDGSDNFPTRYLLNDVCIRLGLPLVYGAVFRFQGQVGVFHAGDGSRPCYRCLFPRPPSGRDAPSCAEAGVLGLMPGIVGCFQAAEAVKYLLDLGQSLQGRLLSIDVLSASTRTARLDRDPECAWCSGSPPDGYPDYQAFCREA